MTISLADFLHQLTTNPTLFITVVLTLGVILVNGWTDAPNAIATVVATRSMSPKSAIVMAAIFNFIGVLVMTTLNSSVAYTIYRMVDFGSNYKNALIALCAALFAIVVWATAAWAFGIPTSESHALIAGITGAAIALQGFNGINGHEWMKVVYGLLISSVLGIGLGFIVMKIVAFTCKKVDKRKSDKAFHAAQIAGGAAMAYMHGAQDGQKFMGVFMLGIFLANGQGNVTTFQIPLWMMILCSLVMAIGTSIGGYKIIKTVGMGMVKLKSYQGFAASGAAVICIYVASAFGIPVSTTHTKTTAIMGVGAAKRVSSVNWRVVNEMLLAWVLTFPGCGLLGFLMSYLFMKLF